MEIAFITISMSTTGYMPYRQDPSGRFLILYFKSRKLII
jgi:hypothetical protein